MGYFKPHYNFLILYHLNLYLFFNLYLFLVQFLKLISEKNYSLRGDLVIAQHALK